MESSVYYERLKAWIAERDAAPYHATPLTPSQMQAIIDLTTPVVESQPEPDVGERDWVSLLHRFRDARQTSGVVVTFVESGKACFWENTVHFEEAGQPTLKFPPGPSYQDAAAPSSRVTFSRKKDAKQFAAKTCVDWLVAEGRMSWDGDNITVLKSKPSKPATPSLPPRGPNLRFTGVLPSPYDLPSAPTFSHDAGRDSKGQPNPAPAQDVMMAEGADEDDEAKEKPVTQKLTVLSKRLGYSVPRYEMTRDPDQDGYWSGRALFGPDHPFEMGHKDAFRVSKVRGKQKTKERIASQLMPLLEKELEQRRSMI